MESHTKNKQSLEKIDQMAKLAFNGVGAATAKELSDGCFNAVYLVGLQDGRKTVLKISPPSDALVQIYEKDLMYAEVEAIRLTAEHTDVPVPEIFYYDRTKKLCDGEFYFMTAYEDEPLGRHVSELSKEELSIIHNEMGSITRKINSVTGPAFGYLGQPELFCDSWFDAFYMMVDNMLKDAEHFDTEMYMEKNELREMLKSEKDLFDQVTTPRLIFWDLHEGNLFYKGVEITGIIDFERAFYGDILMEYGFRVHHEDKSDFYKGYGVSEFTADEERRCLWYDYYLFAMMVAEGPFRNYDSDWLGKWANKMAKECIERLCNK